MTLAATLRRITFVVAVVATSSCDSPVEVCTLIGCESGLTVQLSSLPVGEFTVEVLGEAPALHPPAYRYECVPGAQPCSPRIHFPGLYLERLYVRITTAVGTRVQLAEDVTYRTSYPNGRQCGPECRTATIAVDIPS